MRMEKDTRVLAAKKVCEQFGVDSVVIVLFGMGSFNVSSYGRTVPFCKATAKITDQIFDEIKTGKIGTSQLMALMEKDIFK